MRFSELVQPLTESKVGREYQHLEDLVFVDGSAGAIEAADILQNLGKDTSDVAIKWDGNPTVFWGREPTGEFVLVGKNGWGKQKSTDPEDLANFIKSSGKGEDWREKFGNDMAQIFQIIETATPSNFRGYVFGDLLYHPGKPYQATDNKLQFTPNQVTYTVSSNSQLGKRISTSKVGVAVHGKYKEFGSEGSEPISDVDKLNNRNVVVLGQTYVTHQPTVSTDDVKRIKITAKKYAQSIDDFLMPTLGLSDTKKIIYTYVNQTSRAKKLNELESGFFNWLNSSKVSVPKQAKILAKHQSNPDALPTIFALVKQIMMAKDHIIDQLDQAPADVTASTNGTSGGEGYVALGSKIKLVPRTRWQPV